MLDEIQTGLAARRWFAFQHEAIRLTSSPSLRHSATDADRRMLGAPDVAAALSP